MDIFCSLQLASHLGPTLSRTTAGTPPSSTSDNYTLWTFAAASFTVFKIISTKIRQTSRFWRDRPADLHPQLDVKICQDELEEFQVQVHWQNKEISPCAGFQVLQGPTEDTKMICSPRQQADFEFEKVKKSLKQSSLIFFWRRRLSAQKSILKRHFYKTSHQQTLDQF